MSTDPRVFDFFDIGYSSLHYINSLVIDILKINTQWPGCVNNSFCLVGERQENLNVEPSKITAQNRDEDTFSLERTTAALSEKMNSEMISILHKNLLLSMPVNMICASIVFLSYYFIAQDTRVWKWYVASLIVSLLRLGLPYLYLSRTMKDTSKLVIFIFGAVISAVLWGLIASILLPPNNVLQQMVVIIIIAGISAGGVQTLHPNLTASLLSLCIMLFPISIWFFLQPGITYQVLGLAMLIFILAMFIISYLSNKTLKQNYLLSFKNQALVNNLSIANSNLHLSYLASEASEKMLENILDHAPIGMSLLSLDGTIIKANHAFVDIIGYSETELKTLSLKDIIYPDDLGTELDAKTHLLEGNRFSTELEIRYIHKNGQIIWTHVNISLIRSSYGESPCFIVQTQDISERKKNEALVNELHEETKATIAQLKQRDIEMGYINKMNDMLHACQDVDEAQSVIAMTVQNLFPLLSGGFVLYDKLILNMKTVLQWGEQPILKPNFTINDCWAIRSGNINIINDVKTDLACSHFVSQPKGGCVCVPLISNTGIIGLFFLNASEGHIVTENQIQLAITFSEIIKLFLANIQLREKLQEQTIRDPLTGLYNRRYLDETLPHEMQRVVRGQESLCVAMIDIDQFKKFNDTYGHDAGDEVLKCIGVLLNDTFRAGDIAFRLGGEEFITILINAELSGAIKRLQLVCDKIKSTQLLFQDIILPQITLSVGIAEAPTHGKTAEEILRAADEALYAAKAAGRNRIEVFQIKKTNSKKDP